MNLVRRLLSHSLLILMVVGLIYAYTQRDELYPYLKLSQDEQRDHTQDGRDAVKIQAESVTPSRESVEPVTEGAAAESTEHREIASAVPTPAAADEVAIAATSSTESGNVQTAITEGDETAVGIESGTDGADNAVDASSEMPATASPPPTPSQTAMTPAPMQPPSAATPPGSNTDSAGNALQKARQAYWQRDITAAEIFYRSAMKADPDQPDAYGELGNIYLSQARYREAAEVYYKAATRLREDGRGRQALSLLHIMYRLDPERASRLERTLRENGE